MSATTTPNDSPAHAPIQPLHNPSQAAHVVVPQAPLGNATNGHASQAPGMGAKALLAKKIAKSNNSYISPTDKMMTPVSQKLSASKKKHFSKSAKPMQSLFTQKEVSSDPESSNEDLAESPQDLQMMGEDDNPF
ncbi:hypothetical protein AcW1_004433 [Taiwanofungus camphoratus]|nr:hypothetical protein AcW2_006561 [Antrodia cinnamomea]KAI0939365.1 hypothetical protein AcV5_000807 [Antrodia cinnamomea]KAI0952287.1 hypothetical protein AcV7_008149 [Antrodia cinnamomea]KAI0959670.1 hypothetical protein AcW1_004433 [Antrodia cinnamomea]